MYLKRIPMDGPKNFRDLGGFAAKEGKMIAWNRIYRADMLCGLSQKDIEIWNRLGIKTIVDLRSSSEQSKMPDVVPEGVTYISCPMMNEEIEPEKGQQGAGAFQKSLVMGYVAMVNEAPQLIAKAAGHVMEGITRGGVVLHCTAGKDRTGVLAAVLLMLLGVSEEDIVADYQVTYTYNEKGLNKKVREMVRSLGENVKMDDSMLKSDPADIQKIIDMLSEKNLEQWLVENGTQGGLITAFKQAMLLDWNEVC